MGIRTFFRFGLRRRGSVLECVLLSVAAIEHRPKVSWGGKGLFG